MRKVEKQARVHNEVCCDGVIVSQSTDRPSGASIISVPPSLSTALPVIVHKIEFLIKSVSVSVVAVEGHLLGCWTGAWWTGLGRRSYFDQHRTHTITA